MICFVPNMFDDGDDEDDDVLTLADFPEFLHVVTNQAVNKKCISMGENKQV